MKNNRFFDVASSFYDKMVNSVSSILKKEVFFKTLLNNEFQVAADLGCGSGNDSIALAKNGLKVYAFDPSKEMIEVAKINTQGFKNIKFIRSYIHKIPKRFNKSFHLSVSLGNTLSNISPDLLEMSLQRVYNIMADNSLFIFQILNYSFLKKHNKKIININSSNNQYYIRYNEYPDDKRVIFNILRFEKNNPSSYNLISTTLFHYDINILQKYLKQAGFRRIRFYSDFSFNKYLRDVSSELIGIVEK
ncbi:MAG: class I SAM-dependent methyltransferase [Ignavibacteria bacterium]